MWSTVSAQSIPGAKTKGMIYHVEGCLEDTSLNNITLHHNTDDLRSKEAPEEIAHKILNLAARVKTNKNPDFISALVVRNYQLVKKDNEVNKLLWVNLEQERCYLSIARC